MWSFSVSELAIPGAEIGRISATDADLGENAKLEYTILEGESGDTFNISGMNQEAIITLNRAHSGTVETRRSFPLLHPPRSGQRCRGVLATVGADER
ncbi:Cadherin-24 Precursor [Takifugu flavidus]|uniref:Cadherin-24 n=1 Tax=Takifugu flavidus TaxID=433684 RepID=A0A5C6P4C5_9TELE|nr:Cadherin-24 Precursor [Takifugu flavidus]